MALLQGTDYIRLKDNGDYEIYNSQEERSLYKEAPSLEEVKRVYHEELSRLKRYFYSLMKVGEKIREEGVDAPDEYQDGMEKEEPYKDIALKYFREADNYDKENAVYYHKILDERNNFLNSLSQNDVSVEDFLKMTFPFIEEKVPQCKLLKIKPRVDGTIDLLYGLETKEAYEKAKEMKFFGDTQDI